MPLIKPLNLLFIHIPKTGGMSVTKYFIDKYSITENDKSILYTSYVYIDPKFGVSYGHLKYVDIINNQDYFGIYLNNIKILAVVRNPYLRIVSELFFLNLINIQSDNNFIFEKLKEYLNSENLFDNHKIPQYQMLIDSSGKLPENLTIIKNETLTTDMNELGYTDFQIYLNQNTNGSLNYLKLLNNDSIKLINNYYLIDFEMFEYLMILE